MLPSVSRVSNPSILLLKNASVLLLGPRGTGKTALINQTLLGIANHFKIDLLSGRDFQRYLNEPDRLIQEVQQRLSDKSEKLIVSIDEVQKVPAILDNVHALIEAHKGRLVFLLSGSSARKLRRSGANLLAGRAISQYLHPLNQLEINLNLSKAIHFGTLPGVYLEEQDLAVLRLETYVATYLREEIQQESIVRAIDRFSKFLEFAGQVNGEPVNFSKLGKQIGIAGKTVQEYYSILVDTLIAFQLPGWSQSLKKQLLVAPKYYLFDTGVLNGINGYLRLDIKESSFLYGRLFETFVITQTFAANNYQDLGCKMFYWRDRNGREVDLVIARNLSTPVAAVEIKSGSSPSAADCSGLLVFAEDYPDVPLFCVCTTPRAYTEGRIMFLPWQEYVVNLRSRIND